MTDADLIDLVALMRESQKRYRGSRHNTQLLREALDYEKRVDAELKRRRGGPRLFSEGSE